MTIYSVDNRLYQILSLRNKSITQQTTFGDVYYAPIAEV